MIVFANTKRRIDHLSKQYWADGFGASAIHGDKTQQERESSLAKFVAGEWPLMFATDVAARGLGPTTFAAKAKADTGVTKQPTQGHWQYTLQN